MHIVSERKLFNQIEMSTCKAPKREDMCAKKRKLRGLSVSNMLKLYRTISEMGAIILFKCIWVLSGLAGE